jgi:hypothetical protein
MESKLGDNIDNNAIAQNLGTNQIFLPKNSVQAIPQTNNDVAKLNTVPENATVANNQPVPVQSVVPVGNYYNIFGVELSKTTLYVILAFLVLVGVYCYFKYSKSTKTDKKKSKKKSKKAKEEESSDEESE